MSKDLKQALHIASLFALPGPVEVSDFTEKGNINRQAFLIVAGPTAVPREYILQQLNPEVFKQPHGVMEAMIQFICGVTTISRSTPPTPGT